MLELLYDCNGLITRLELFNLKDWAGGHTEHIPAISRLQETINTRNPIKLKRVILEIVQQVEARNDPATRRALAKLRAILHDISSLQAMYQDKPIRTRIGSDSTGRSPKFHGMGLVVVETLPPRARRQARKDLGTGRDRIPIHFSVHRRHTFITSPRRNCKPEIRGWFTDAGPLPWWVRAVKKVDWAVPGDATRMSDQGNVITLGGVEKRTCNDLSVTPPSRGRRRRPSWRYVNSHLRNLFKVVIGFVPAFATFF